MNFASESGSGVSSWSLHDKFNEGSAREVSTPTQKSTYPYLQALLGDNPPTPGLFDHATRPGPSYMTPILNVKEEPSVSDDDDKFTDFKIPAVPPLR